MVERFRAVKRMSVFHAFYGNITYRIWRWRTFQNDQKSMATLITDLRSMQVGNRKLILAYGSWANASATFNPKGIAPCIGIGLRRRLAKEFVVVDTPEHYTSKTCSKCYGPCGPFAALETRRRAEAKANASTPEEEKKASLLHKINPPLPKRWMWTDFTPRS